MLKYRTNRQTDCLAQKWARELPKRKHTDFCAAWSMIVKTESFIASNLVWCTQIQKHTLITSNNNLHEKQMRISFAVVVIQCVRCGRPTVRIESCKSTTKSTEKAPIFSKQKSKQSENFIATLFVCLPLVFIVLFDGLIRNMNSGASQIFSLVLRTKHTHTHTVNSLGDGYTPVHFA